MRDGDARAAARRSYGLDSVSLGGAPTLPALLGEPCVSRDSGPGLDVAAGDLDGDGAADLVFATVCAGWVLYGEP